MVTIEQIKNVLPSGSGFDCDWHVEEKEDKIFCSTDYHKMNDVGFYVGYVHIDLVIPKENPTDFDLAVEDEDDMLPQYIADTITEALADL